MTEWKNHESSSFNVDIWYVIIKFLKHTANILATLLLLFLELLYTHHTRKIYLYIILYIFIAIWIYSVIVMELKASFSLCFNELAAFTCVMPASSQIFIHVQNECDHKQTILASLFWLSWLTFHIQSYILYICH